MVDWQQSAPVEIPHCGVPQGSIGGPILWLIFTFDQTDVVHKHQIDRQIEDAVLWHQIVRKIKQKN